MANSVLARMSSALIREPVRVADLARRPEVPLSDLLTAIGQDGEREAVEWANIELKYSGYMAKERSAADRMARMESLEIPSGLEYRTLDSLSTEAREKLSAVRPTSLGQASRIPGVSPSDIHNLIGAVLKLRSLLSAVSRETEALS
jgi:tRNA uridine 5-carboxymethylaminomethyl modification enzyme